MEYLPVTKSAGPGGGDGGSDDVEKVSLIHRFITGFYLLDIHPPTLLLLLRIFAPVSLRTLSSPHAYPRFIVGFSRLALAPGRYP